MKPRVVLGGLLLGLAACRGGPALDADTYIAAMTEVGCAHFIDEQSAEAQAIYRKHGTTYEAITGFRRQMPPDQTGRIATTIAQQVAACYGVSTP